jgi:enoyl-CoA hydratase
MASLALERAGRVTLLTIDRPPANALDVELLEEGEEVVGRLAADPPDSLVIAGTRGFFSAGVDLKATPGYGPDEQRRMVDGLNGVFGRLYTLGCPVVCAVTGHAIAGGLILALCGDHRVGATEGRLGLTEVKAGVPYPVAAMAVVRAELTPQVARRLVLSAELVEPDEALELGLVDELRPLADVVPRAVEVAESLAALPREAYRTVKAQLRGERLDLPPDPMLGAWLGEETREAAEATLRGGR